MGPDASTLPFLVVHGAWLWIVLLVALTLATWPLIGLARRLHAYLRTKEALRWRAGQAITRLAEGDATVQGTVHGGTARSLWAQGAGRDAPVSVEDERATELWLEVGDERVTLDGPLAIELGARRQMRRRRPPAGATSATRDKGWFRLEEVGEGDVVLVRGRLIQRADAIAVGDYRTPAGGWVLVAKEERLQVMARHPVARASPIGAGWIVVLAVVALAWYGVLHHIGHSALADLGDERRPALSAFGDAAIAAAMPGSRDDALHLLDRELERAPLPDDDALRRALTIADLVRGCGGVVAVLEQVDRFTDALDRARRCGLQRDVYDMLVSLGRYDDAVAMTDAGFDRRWPYREGMVAVAAGRWDLAARAADAMLDKLQADPDEAAQVPRVRCLAQLMKRRAGEASAIDTGSDDPWCRFVRVEAEPADRRREDLAALTELAHHDVDQEDFDVGVLALELHALDEPVHDDVIDDPYDAAKDLLEVMMPGQRLWLASFTAPTALTPAALAWRSDAEWMRGDTAGARRDAAAAPVGASEVDRDVLALTASAVGVRAADADLPTTRHDGTLSGALELRSGKLPRDLTLVGDDACDGSSRDAWSDALTGDGRALAKMFGTCEVFWSFAPIAVLAVLPRIQSGREELAAALRTWTSEDDRSGYVFGDPLDHLWYLALRRDLLRAAGDSDDAAALQAILDRAAPMLDDRDRVVALLLWKQ